MTHNLEKFRLDNVWENNSADIGNGSDTLHFMCINELAAEK